MASRSCSAKRPSQHGHAQRRSGAQRVGERRGRKIVNPVRPYAGGGGAMPGGFAGTEVAGRRLLAGIAYPADSATNATMLTLKRSRAHAGRQ